MAIHKTCDYSNKCIHALHWSILHRKYNSTIFVIKGDNVAPIIQF